MGILASIAQRLSGRAFALTAAIPWRRRSLGELKLEAVSEPQADGDRVRLRAHLHLRLPGEHGATRDLNSWVEVRASNASLDEGATALLPADKLDAIGVHPQANKPVQTWAGALRGRPGYAVLTLLRLEKAGLPAALRRLLGARPFALSATAASVVEETL